MSPIQITDGGIVAAGSTELRDRAKLVIGEPIESFFEEPLESVRLRLGLPRQPASAGVEASGRSLFQDWMYPTVRTY